MVRKFLILMLTLALNLVVLAATDPSVCVKSTEGKDFWFGFMESRHHQSGHYLEITMTSIYACQFNLYIGKSTTPYLSSALTPNVPFRYTITWSVVEPIGSELIESKAIHITSTMPMNIFAMNWSPSSADAAVIFPVDALGNEYYAVCYEPHINEGAGGAPGNGKNSEFLVVATVDNTKVTITPTKVTDQLRKANVPFTITLNKGELYQVQSMNHANLVGQGDLTGSHIVSDKPVAFYSGSWSTTIPADLSVDAYDHLYEQIPPVRSWGRKYVTVPLSGRSEDRFRILAAEDKTTIRINGGTPILLNKGSFYEFVLKSNQPSYIESDRSILLAQFMVSNSVDRPTGVPNNSWDGDPLMLIISPVDQTRENVTFVAYDSPNIKSKYFVNVITKFDAMSNITLDNKMITFTQLPGTEYAYAQIPITKGNHNLNSTVVGKGFIAYVYGYGGVESYGYGVGFNLNIKMDLGGDFHFLRDTTLICQGGFRGLDAGSHFSRFLWNTGDTTQFIMAKTAGYYKVKAWTTEGCFMTDSIYAFVSNPVVKLVNDTIICNYKSLLLDAGAGFVSYRWSNKDSTRTTTAKTQGMYSVVTVNKYDCQAKDSVYVSFVGRPKISLLQLDTLVCGSKTTKMSISADKGTLRLTSSNPVVSISGLDATVPQYGTYPFMVNATDLFTCTADTTFKVGFHEVPVINLGNDTTICNPASILLDAGPGRKSYEWVTKDSTQTIRVTKQGNYWVYVRNKYGCPGQDNIQVNFVDKPRLNLSGLDTLFCGVKTATLKLAVDKGTYQLQSTATPVTIRNLDVSTSSFGTFPFTFHSIDPYGCRSDTAFSVGFHKIPTVEISVDDTTCYGYSLDARYLGDAETPIARFTWLFAKDTVGNDLGLTQIKIKLGMDRSKRDLFLKVMERGCYNTQVVREISVIPDLGFMVSDTLLCQPLTFSFGATNTENVIDYQWDFGDGTTVHNGKDISHHYEKDGYYTVQLTATTDKNCVNTVKKDSVLYVAPVPTVDFSLREEQCLDLGPQSLLFTGKADDKDHYNWDLSGFSAGELVRNPGDSKGPLVFQLKDKPKTTIKLQVVSKYGCISDQKSLIVKRIPGFSFQAKDSAGCIPFVADLRALTADKIDQVDYTWHFGDGSNGTGTAITHTFPVPDNVYDLTLMASSTLTGCSDTLFKPAFFTVYPQPVADFFVNDSILSNENPVATFTNQSTGADHYLWRFGDGQISRLAEPVHRYEVVGPRNVLLEAGNEFGCMDTTARQVVIALNKIYTPNAFSPVAPNLADREFFPYCTGVEQKGYHLKIINRWNEVIYSVDNAFKGWDGRLMDGSMAPVGNYIWILYFTDFLGKSHFQKGTVTMVL